MNRQFVKSLQFKVIVAIFAAMLFFGTLATFIVWARVRTDLIDEQNSSVAAEADEQSHEIAEIFRNSAFLARAVAQFPAIISALSTKSFDSESVSHELEHFNLGSRYASIYVMDATGKTIASTDRSFINNNYGFRKYFLDAIQGKEGFLIAIGVTTKEPGYYFSAPVIGPDGSVIGVGVVKLKPDSIIESLSRTSLTRFGKMMMVNDDGIVIYSDKPDRLYRSLGQLSMADMQRITASKDFENTNITPLQYGQVNQAVKNYSEEITVSFYDQVEKEEEYLTVARVDNFNAYLVTEIGLTKLDAMARTAATTVAAMLVLIGIAMMAAIYLLLSRFLHPLEDLQRFARLVSAGSLGERLTISTGDELQVLAESFNHMAQNIEESYEQLEQKIQVQTTDISKKGFEIEDMKKAMYNVLEDMEQSKEILLIVQSTDEGLLSGIDEGVVIIGTDGMVKRVNANFVTITGITEPEMAGSRFDALYDLADSGGKPVNLTDWPVKKVIRTGEEQNWQPFIMVRHDGTRIPVEIKAKPIRYDDTFAGVISFFRPGKGAA